MAENAPQSGHDPGGQRSRAARSPRIAAVPSDDASGEQPGRPTAATPEAQTEEMPAGGRSWTETETVLQRLGLLDAQGNAVPPGVEVPGGRADDSTVYGGSGVHAGSGPARRRGGAWPPPRLMVVLAVLALVVAVLAVPTIILSWRAALASTPSVSGVVAGVLSAVGVLLLAVGGGWLAVDAAGGRGSVESGRGLAVLGRTPVIVAASGVLTLACAAAAAT